MIREWDVIILGGGLAGLSGAIYLSLAQRKVLVIDEGKSMARWEPEVENYLGFPDRISGEELLKRGRSQAENYGAEFAADKVTHIEKQNESFICQGKENLYSSRRILLATGIFHQPPDLEGVTECMGKTKFFCKDCDGYKVRDKRILIYGNNHESVEYALGILAYSSSVGIVTDGKSLNCDPKHLNWLKEYKIPIYTSKIVHSTRKDCFIKSIELEDGKKIEVDAIFTTRGDICINELARDLGAEVDPEGQVKVNHCLQTTVAGVYAAGCVTPANCQMIISAGQGAQAAQAINRDLFEESLEKHDLMRKT
jgi:thioredoxin reductase (NADPH)